MNLSYKILTSILANRLANCLPYIINPQQTGFIKGRNIRENIRTMKYIFEQVQNDEEQHGYLILLDFAKAYDRVDREYMMKVIEAFGVGSIYTQWIATVYSKPLAKVL